MAVQRVQTRVSDVQFRRDVANTIYSIDGIWSPDTSKLQKVDGKKLTGALKAEYVRMTKDHSTTDVFTTKVDGRSVYLLSAFDADLGAAVTALRDANGKPLKIGTKPHAKLPLPHSEEPSRPVSRAQWLKDLKDAMRYPVQARDTPIIKGKDIPPGVRPIISKMLAEKDSYGMKRYESVEVHHVRVDGHDSYLIYGNAEDGVSEEMFEANGKKLDVMF